MKAVGLMQPYLYPYIGYYQLMSKVEVWVSYDDVKYPKQGWCNRNRLWDGRQVKMLSLPLAKSSSDTDIKDKSIFDKQKFIEWNLSDLHRLYKSSDHFKEVFEHLESTWKAAPDGDGLGDFLFWTIQKMARLLDLSCEIQKSSHLGHGLEKVAQERVLAICEGLGGQRYLNAPGGRDLYDGKAFEERGMRLGFLKPKVKAYDPFSGGPSQQGLSVIDMLFNLGVPETARQAHAGECDWLK